jgi:hypothetical protein
VIPTFLLLVALPAAAQNMKDTGRVFCVCDAGPRGWAGTGTSYPTCEAFCGTDKPGGFSGPRHDPYEQQRRNQEAVERARRIREDAERAARAEREKLEKERRFQQDKREALGQLKGVTVAEPQLKGVGGDSGGLKGLKGLDAPKAGLKGVEEAAGKSAKCLPSVSCFEAMDKQAASMEKARFDQTDLYFAVGTADLKHGLEKVSDKASEKIDALKQQGVDMLNPRYKAEKEQPEFYVWRNADMAGWPRYAKEYKRSVDDIYKLITSQRAAALGGKYDPAVREWDRSSGGKLTNEAAKKKLDKLKSRAAAIKSFAEYMAELKKCGEGRDSDFDKCVRRVGDAYQTAFDQLLKEKDLALDTATMARVRAATDAYTRYTNGALTRAKDAADSASRCYSDCR